MLLNKQTELNYGGIPLLHFKYTNIYIFYYLYIIYIYTTMKAKTSTILFYIMLGVFATCSAIILGLQIGFNTKILVAIAFIGLEAMLYWFYDDANHNEMIAANNIEWPPKQYMDTIGNKCPDYWIYNNNKKKCENKFNIPVNHGVATGVTTGATTGATNSYYCYDTNVENTNDNINPKYIPPPTLPDADGIVSFAIINGVDNDGTQNGGAVRTFTDKADRIKWIQNCGPRHGHWAAWSGVDNTI
jgi:hypothetical protein